MTKLENVCIMVNDNKQASGVYGGLFDITVYPPKNTVLPDGMEVWLTLSDAEIELIGQAKPCFYREGLRTLSLRVPDIEKTASDAKSSEIPIEAEFESDIGQRVKEIICYASGIRVPFERYDE